MLCRENGSPIDPGWLSKQFRRRVAAEGLPPLTLHGLRHTHATIALQAGVHPKVISERLGHYSAAFTQDIYQHALEGLQGDAASRMTDLLFTQ
jgi:integrase